MSEVEQAILNLDRIMLNPALSERDRREGLAAIVLVRKELVAAESTRQQLWDAQSLLRSRGLGGLP